MSMFQEIYVDTSEGFISVRGVLKDSATLTLGSYTWANNDPHHKGPIRVSLAESEEEHSVECRIGFTSRFTGAQCDLIENTTLG